MAKNNEVADSAAEAQAPVAPDAGFELTLDEFCIRLSNTDKRVELIGGFAYSERAAGTIKDTESAFKARFAAFATKPV